MNRFTNMLTSDFNNRSILLIRIMTGAVFLSEGIQKFLFPAMRGTGRFASMGFTDPQFFANFVAFFEIFCGILLLTGLLTRGAAAVMLINMSVAIIVTKIPILIGHNLGPFIVREMKMYGFWSMAHEMRTDFAMWLGCLFLLFSGSGGISLDSRLYNHIDSYGEENIKN